MFIASAKTPQRRFLHMPGDPRGRPTSGAERNELLRELVRAIQRDDFDGNLSAVGRALKLKSPATLADFLGGTKNAGLKIMDGLASYTGRTLEEIYASGGDLAKLRAPALPPEPVQHVRFRDLPEWAEMLAKAKELRPSIDDRHWNKLADADAWIEGTVNTAMVIELTEFLMRHR